VIIESLSVYGYVEKVWINHRIARWKKHKKPGVKTLKKMGRKKTEFLPTKNINSFSPISKHVHPCSSPQDKNE
jgi:hypothetical protein